MDDSDTWKNSRMFNKRNRYKQVSNDYVRIENVYGILPPDGTIIDRVMEKK